MKTVWQYSILGLFILINLTLVVHWNTGDTLPSLGDEYIHIGFARQLVEEGVLPFTNPYLLSHLPHQNYESGFHFLLAGIYALLGDSLIYGYQLLVAVIFIINSLLLYHLVRLWRVDHAVALISTFFFGTITTTGGMLAHNFFLPLTVGVSLLLLLFIFWHQWAQRERARSWWYLVVTAAITLITYPPALIFFSLVTATHLLVGEHTLTTRFKLTPQKLYTRTVLAVATGMCSLIGIMFVTGNTEVLFFTREWEILHLTFSPLLYLGTVAAAAFTIGLYVLLFQDSYTYQRLPLYWIICSLVLLYGNYMFEFGVLLPFPRLFFFYLIGFSIVAGIGFVALLRKIRQSHIPFHRSLSILVAVLLLSVQYFGAKADSSAEQPIITEAEIALLDQYVTPTGDAAAVITDNSTAFGVYPTTGAYVGGLLNANISGGDPRSITQVLTAPSCTEKKLALHRLTAARTAPLKQAHPVFVMSDTQLSCTYLQPVATSTKKLYRLTTPFPRFTANERSTLIPKPPDDTAESPGIAITDPSELRTLVAGNTFFGDGWRERYHADRHYSSIGSGDAHYAGLWDINGPFYCFYDLIEQSGDCVYLSKEGTQINSYNSDGTYRQSFEWRAGHGTN